MTQPPVLTPPFGTKEIEQILPHRYPFLLVDRIESIGDGMIVGIKHVTANEWYFQGHFPGQPVMPGVLQIEALAQTGAVYSLMKPENAGKIVVFGAIENARFRKMIQPGEMLRLEVRELSDRRGIAKSDARLFAGDQLACEAKLTSMVVPGVR